MVGGDDSVPIPFLAGLAAGGPLTVLQVDAHIDWRDERRGERLGFSSTMRRASEMAHVERIVQVGMRNFGTARAQEVQDAAAWGAHVVTAREVHHDGVGGVLEHIPRGARVAITIDLDAFDASLMPAVMAPTPGGLDYTQVTDLDGGRRAARHARGRRPDRVRARPRRHGLGAATAVSLLLFAVGVLANA